MNIDTINKYLDELQSKIDGRTISFVQNGDGAHNAAVIISMLRNASSIYMFCGAASVFSESFFRNISHDNTPRPRYSYDVESGMNVVSGWDCMPDSTRDIGNYLRNTMNTGLEEYLSDNRKTINIIVEDKNKMESKTFLPSIVNNSKSGFKDNVRIYALDNLDFFRGLVDHFSYALNEDEELFMARMENDGKGHKADCIFYPTEDMRGSLIDTYSNFASVSSKL